ncbi:MAG: haloacid dehalogenase, partial [Muribaculaceae bacterium]|nr:haloacid dehalogenase [Muribaculaceae bacterium]
MASTHYSGLTDAEVAESRQQHGPNILTPPKKASLWRQFLEKFNDPLIIILLIAGVLSVGISIFEYYKLYASAGLFFEPIGIFAAIILAPGMAFIFEARAGKAFDILNQVNDDEPVQVIRNGAVTEIPKKDVVVGDICILNTGDEVPADGELLEATMLSIDESSLTGEPICAKTVVAADFDPNATFPSNHVLRGTKVMEGHAVFRVTEVGD